MRLFMVDMQKCTRDGLCVAECPLHILELNEGSPVPTPTPDAEERCIRCGHCVAVCPHGAFSLAVMQPSDCPPVGETLAFEPAEQFLRSRRSIRVYQKKPVEREKLVKLIEAARYSPTGTNSQRVGWLVISSPESVKQLAGMVIDMLRYMVANQHPMTAKYHLGEMIQAWESDIDGICRGAPALVVAHAPKDYPLATVDCTSALAYLDLAAPSLGLGTCWAGFLMLAMAQWPPLLQAIPLPEGHAAFGAMMIGYPQFKYHRLPLRNPPEIIWRE
jgi:nitroreductase/NAD-dependent dihydropyrimidine dehydrogenase PreA subunit